MYSKSLFFFISITCFFLIDASTLPDYEAYKKIYLNPIIVGIFSGWEPLFVLIMLISNLLNIEYEIFRLIFYFLSIFILYQALFFEDYKPKNLTNSIFNVSLITIFLIYIILEFFLIRIRAGIVLASLSLIILLFQKQQKPFLLLLIIPFYFIHQTSTLIYVFAILATFIFLREANIGLKLLVVFFGSVIFLGLIDLLSTTLREDLVSELNFYRAILTLLMPCIFWIVWKYFIKLKTILHIDTLEMAYIVFCAAGTLMYFAGYFSESGESIVRAYSAFSVILFFFMLSESSPTRNPVTTYIILANFAFFLNTLSII